jgi:hypothetical protein
MAAGILLVWAGKLLALDIWGIIIFFIGISAMSIRLSYSLSRKYQK